MRSLFAKPPAAPLEWPLPLRVMKTTHPKQWLCPKPGQPRLDDYRCAAATDVAATIAQARLQLPAPGVRRLPTLVVDHLKPAAPSVALLRRTAPCHR